MIKLASEKNKKIGIFGLARTGLASYEALKGTCAKLLAWDDSDKNREIFQEKYGSDSLIPIENDEWKDLDEIVLSPGVPTKLPKPHRIAEIANEYNINLISDMDLLYRAKKDKAFIVAVTGTNGKSTSSALIHHIVSQSGYKWNLGGNIGNAALNMDDDAVGYVLEASSYQIELSKDFKSKIAVLLNITPDHLDRHGTMEEYIRVKRSLVENAEIAVIGIDNHITGKIYEENKNNLKLTPISVKKKLDKGISIQNNILYDNIASSAQYNIPTNLNLKGDHNLENIAASYAVCRNLGLDPEFIIKNISTFKGLPHRFQYLGKKSGIDFYNDSKATNMESVRKAVESIQNIHLLAGGVRKKDGIDSILDLKDHIKEAYFYGEAAESFAKEAGNQIKHGIYDTLEEAFNASLKKSANEINGATILLSPGCASFDQFKDFEERGYSFIELYDKL